MRRRAGRPAGRSPSERPGSSVRPRGWRSRACRRAAADGRRRCWEDQLVADALADAARDRRDVDLASFSSRRRAEAERAIHRPEAAAVGAGAASGASTAQRPRARGAPRRGRRPAACRTLTPQTTTFTILCGTTMTFLAGLPSSARMHAVQLQGRSLDLVLGGVRAIVSSSRRLPLTCTAMVIVSSTSKRRLGRRPRLIGEQGVVAEPRPAFLGQMRHHRRRSCCTSNSAASRRAQARPSPDLASAAWTARWSARRSGPRRR